MNVICLRMNGDEIRVLVWHDLLHKYTLVHLYGRKHTKKIITASGSLPSLHDARASSESPCHLSFMHVFIIHVHISSMHAYARTQHRSRACSRANRNKHARELTPLVKLFAELCGFRPGLLVFHLPSHACMHDSAMHVHIHMTQACPRTCLHVPCCESLEQIRRGSLQGIAPHCH